MFRPCIIGNFESLEMFSWLRPRLGEYLDSVQKKKLDSAALKNNPAKLKKPDLTQKTLCALKRFPGHVCTRRAAAVCRCRAKCVCVLFAHPGTLPLSLPHPPTPRAKAHLPLSPCFHPLPPVHRLDAPHQSHAPRPGTPRETIAAKERESDKNFVRRNKSEPTGTKHLTSVVQPVWLQHTGARSQVTLKLPRLSGVADLSVCGCNTRL